MDDDHLPRIVGFQEKQPITIEELASSPRNRRKSYEIQAVHTIEDCEQNKIEDVVECDAAITRNGRNKHSIKNKTEDKSAKKSVDKKSKSSDESPTVSPRTSSNSTPQSPSQPVVAVKHEIPGKGIIEVNLAKDNNGKLGMKTKNIRNGIYVMEMLADSPAAKAGLFPGDQILQFNGVKIDEYNDDKMHRLFKKQPANENIRMLVNKRPLEKVFSFKRDANELVGFHLRGPKIQSVIKQSLADIQGLSNEFYLLEVNGTPIRGLKDSKVRKLIEDQKDEIKITVMPYYLYEPLFKQIPIR